MTELVLIRHGETDWNRELRFQGQVDVPLNATGHAQARRLAARLAGAPAQALYASDLARAVQTAQPIAPALGAPLPDAPVPEPGLREQAFGIVDGWRVDEIRRAHPQAWDAWTRFDEQFAFDGGESTRQFHARVLDAVMRLARRHEGQTLVIVTHGGVLDMLFRSARGLSLSGPRSCDIPNAGLNRMRLDAEGRLHILDWADTRHLDGLPPQPVYDQKGLSGVAQAAVDSTSPSPADA